MPCYGCHKVLGRKKEEQEQYGTPTTFLPDQIWYIYFLKKEKEEEERKYITFNNSLNVMLLILIILIIIPIAKDIMCY